MATENSLGDILSSLLENPEVMKAVSSIASNTEKAEDADGSEKKAESSEGFTLPPELLSKLPQMMSAISGLGQLPTGKKDEGVKGTMKGDKQRKALLFALKPYLCEKRCALIDGLLQLEGLAGVIGALSDK